MCKENTIWFKKATNTTQPPNNQPKGRDDELYICAQGVRKRSVGAGQTAEFFADRRSERPNDSSEA